LEIYEKILELKKSGSGGVLITVVEKEGHGPAPVQARMLIADNEEKTGTVGGGALEFAALRVAAEVKVHKKPQMKKFLMGPDDNIIEGEPTGMLCGGAATLFFEYLGSGFPVTIFGAGHVGRSLVYHMQDMGFYITLVDSREEVLNPVTGVQGKVHGNYASIFSGETVKPGGYYIIATHSHQLDYVVLKRIYSSGWQPAYVGLMASRRKRDVMLDQLHNELGSDLDLSALYSPVGLDTGGGTPGEIAFSIIAEIQALRYGKAGHKHMKNKEKK